MEEAFPWQGGDSVCIRRLWQMCWVVVEVATAPWSVLVVGTRRWALEAYAGPFNHFSDRHSNSGIYAQCWLEIDRISRGKVSNWRTGFSGLRLKVYPTTGYMI